MKFSTRSLAFLAGGLMIGTALAPVGAQQIAPADGQVAVRSDGAVYVIANGQRRWVATVVISDEELNAYPEGEPIYAGLAPIGSGATAAAPPAGASTAPRPAAVASPVASPVTNAAPASAASPASASGSASTTASPTAGGSTGAPNTAIAAEISPDLPLEVDIDGTSTFEQGERMAVVVKTKVGAACELSVRWPDGREINEDSKTANSRGRCEYSIGIARTMTEGVGVLKGIVRDSGRISRQDVEFTVIRNS